MPRYYRKRNYYRRRNVRRGKKRVPMFGRADRAVGKAAWYMAKKALSLINVERKFSDVTSTGTSVNATRILLNGLSTGDSTNQRNGQSIKVTQIYCQLKFNLNASATDTTIRYMLILDRDPRGVIYNISDLLQDYTNYPITSPLNLDSNVRRYTVLMDRRLKLNTNYPETIRRINVKRPIHVRYDPDDTGTITDIAYNSIYLMFLSDESTNYPTVQYYCRIRFIDN